ncbi:hypothetical protein B0H10DRAFT_1970001 [Mycena sp. CBHHK59/15]|nr:hypothetical protein B0H10DRAFT_1970001 [Mycena sp. CBHHK59/15]
MDPQQYLSRIQTWAAATLVPSALGSRIPDRHRSNSTPELRGCSSSYRLSKSICVTSHCVGSRLPALTVHLGRGGHWLAPHSVSKLNNPGYRMFQHSLGFWPKWSEFWRITRLIAPQLEYHKRDQSLAASLAIDREGGRRSSKVRGRTLEEMHRQSAVISGPRCPNTRFRSTSEYPRYRNHAISDEFTARMDAVYGRLSTASYGCGYETTRTVYVAAAWPYGTAMTGSSLGLDLSDCCAFSKPFRATTTIVRSVKAGSIVSELENATFNITPTFNGSSRALGTSARCFHLVEPLVDLLNRSEFSDHRNDAGSERAPCSKLATTTTIEPWEQQQMSNYVTGKKFEYSGNNCTRIDERKSNKEREGGNLSLKEGGNKRS